MKSTTSRTIAVLGLASSLLLGQSGSHISTALAQPPPEQVAHDALPPGQDQPAGNAASPRTTNDPAKSEGLNDFLSGLLDAIRENDSLAVCACIDTDQLCAEMQRQQIASVPSPVERTALRVALKMVVGDGLLEQAAAEGWRNFHVQRLTIHAAEPSVANVNMLNQEGRKRGAGAVLAQPRQPGGVEDQRLARGQLGFPDLVACRHDSVGVSRTARRARNQRLLAAADAASRGDMAASERIVLELADEKLSPARGGTLAAVRTNQVQPG